MKLKVVRRYASAQAVYEAGAVIDVDEDFGAWLQRDAPECFEPFAPEVKEVAAPPKDKAVRRAPRTKAARSKKDENG